MTPLHAGEQSGGADAPRFSADGGHSAAERPVSTETRGLRLAGDVFTHHPGLRGRPSRRVRRSPYDALVREMKERYRVAVRKWRKGMSGAAYELKYRDGRIKRLITAPRPAGPVSAAIFLHEVGHHAVGFRRYAPRVLRHYRRSMFFYVRAAQRAGAVPLPAEVHGFMHWPG